MPFEEDYEDLDKTKGGLKKQPNASMFDKPKVPEVDLKKAAQEAAGKSLEYKNRASLLSSRFKKFLDDKTISENKNQMADELEKELIAEMINLAIEINQDEDENEGMGSVGWIALLLRVTLLQKTRINDLEYRISVLENKSLPHFEKVRIKT